MKEKKSYQSWTVSDEFWEEVKDKIPVKKQNPQRERRHAPGQGRPPIPSKKMLEGIFYVLRTGCQWEAAPRKYDCVSSIHQYYQGQVAADFFETIWAMGLTKYDGLQGTGQEWQSLDGYIIKTSLVREAVNHNPAGRRRNGNREKRPDRRKRVTVLCCAFRCQHA